MTLSSALFELFKILSQKEKTNFFKLLKEYNPAPKRNPNEPYTDPILYEEGFFKDKEDEMKLLMKVERMNLRLKKDSESKAKQKHTVGRTISSIVSTKRDIEGTSS